MTWKQNILITNDMQLNEISNCSFILTGWVRLELVIVLTRPIERQVIQVDRWWCVPPCTKQETWWRWWRRGMYREIILLRASSQPFYFIWIALIIFERITWFVTVGQTVSIHRDEMCTLPRLCLATLSLTWL